MSIKCFKYAGTERVYYYNDRTGNVLDEKEVLRLDKTKFVVCREVRALCRIAFRISVHSQDKNVMMFSLCCIVPEPGYDSSDFGSATEPAYRTHVVFVGANLDLRTKTFDVGDVDPAIIIRELRKSDLISKIFDVLEDNKPFLVMLTNWSQRAMLLDIYRHGVAILAPEYEEYKKRMVLLTRYRADNIATYEESVEAASAALSIASAAEETEKKIVPLYGPLQPLEEPRPRSLSPLTLPPPQMSPAEALPAADDSPPRLRTPPSPLSPLVYSPVLSPPTLPSFEDLKTPAVESLPPAAAATPAATPPTLSAEQQLMLKAFFDYAQQHTAAQPKRPSWTE